jgi:hypothetical protein
MDGATATAAGPTATYDTAVACLCWLRDETASETPPDPAAPDYIPLTRLVALVREFGFEGELAYLDWSGLHRRGFTAGLLVLLRSGNVAVVTGGSRGEIEEVAVWDPLDPGGEPLFVPRAIFERAWSGYVVIARRAAARLPRRLPRAVAAPPRPYVGLAAASLIGAGIAVFLAPASLTDRIAGLLSRDPIGISFFAAQALPADEPHTPPAALMARGDGYLRRGDIAAARPLFRRAAEAGVWQAAVRLGETFDPSVLAHRGLDGTGADAAAARLWYGRARALGASDSEILHLLYEAW